MSVGFLRMASGDMLQVPCSHHLSAGASVMQQHLQGSMFAGPCLQCTAICKTRKQVANNLLFPLDARHCLGCALVASELGLA